MPEKEIEQLAKSTGHESFLVLAEWLRKNREDLRVRLTRQDAMLSELKRELREVKKDGKETKAETRKTNGRVTELERQHAGADGEARERQRHAQGWKGWQLAAAVVVINALLLLGVHLLPGLH